MTYDGRYDDPKFIDAFLADLKFSDSKAAENIEKIDGHGNKSEETKVQALSNQTEPYVETSTDPLPSAAVSPPTGIRAPPPTPESKIVATSTPQPLPPIDESSNASPNGVTKLHEEAKPPQGFSPIATPFRPTARLSTESHSEPRLAIPPNESRFADDMQKDDSIRNYQLNAFAKFKEQALARIALRDFANNSRHEQVPGAVPETGYHAALSSARDGEPSADGGFLAKHPEHAPSNNTSSLSDEQFRNTHDESTAIYSESDDDESIEIIVDAPKSPDSIKSRKSVILIPSPDQSVVETGTPEKKDFEDMEQVNIKVEPPEMVNDAPREHASYFTTWGTPSAREASPARVRKIILSNVPASADFTLVQSLIHGGAIEHMTIAQAANGSTTASVTFTNADACESYYTRYPNGLEFKHRGIKHVTFINKGENVDVVSGALRTQLECGASRVVRAAGADDDWSMRALHRVAEGKNVRRKVETIFDNYRNDSRTIVFRFTKIADAVTFRGHLLRDPDWEGVDIQFMPDPCEKATSIHFD